jgi:ABC-type cobalamin/Fe3+-siderophores transport system ATPase subunit
MPKKDPFADFTRVRLEMDELLVDFWERPGLRTQRRPVGFAPRVDVYYLGGNKPEVAVVRAEIPGVEVSAVNLEVRGRTLVISGEKPQRETSGRSYQQVELPSGPFRRVIELAIEVDPERAVDSLAPGQQQLLEIARALQRRASVLIFDEPTSSLSDRETERLYRVVRELQARGTAIVWITHRMGEVQAIADRVVALRDGEVTGAIPASEASHQRMV